MNNPHLNDESASEITGEKNYLHQPPSNERKIKISRKWVMWIGIILLALVVIDGSMLTIVFMMRKGMW